LAIAKKFQGVLDDANTNTWRYLPADPHAFIEPRPHAAVRVWVAPGGLFNDVPAPPEVAKWANSVLAQKGNRDVDYHDPVQEMLNRIVCQARDKFKKDCAPDVGHPWDDHGNM
jgi:hypothetical protein